MQKVRFVLVILDNRTTAMTGNQPTPATGLGACGEPLDCILLMMLAPEIVTALPGLLR